jgi:DinB superfamily
MREMPAVFRWVQRYEAVRQTTVLLAAPLSAEDACVQSMPDASPAKWHLAHTTWFFETFVLAEHAPGVPPFDPDFRVLFNSYYQQVGARHPRAQRGLLTQQPALGTGTVLSRGGGPAHAADVRGLGHAAACASGRAAGAGPAA